MVEWGSQLFAAMAKDRSGIFNVGTMVDAMGRGKREDD
jgi:hypothetical protein